MQNAKNEFGDRGNARVEGEVQDMLIEGGRCSRAREALVIIRVVGGVVAIPPYLPELPKGMFIRSKNLLSPSQLRVCNERTQIQVCGKVQKCRY